MKTSGQLAWTGIDLHVHTPASRDYKGLRGDEGYLELAGKANEFSREKGQPKDQEHELTCAAFTDHNSIDGFKRYRELRDETAHLRDSIRLRDPNNSLITKLEKDLETLNSIRTFMGCEIKANPGIHLLLIFSESVRSEEAVQFLEAAYSLEYSSFAGDPSPTTVWTLPQVLDETQARFGDRAMIIAPHIDSGGGLYEALKDFQQIRMIGFKHPVLTALSFNKPETRDRVLQLLQQPEYRRSEPLAMIQSSDYHGQQGMTLGQPRSEVYVPAGKATFTNIREAFRTPNRVKCSCDFTQDEYDRLTQDETVIKFQSEHGTLAFRESDLEKLATTVGAMLNSSGGIIDLQGEPPVKESREAYLKALIDEFYATLKDRVDPPWRPGIARDLRFSPTRVRVLFKVLRSQRLHTVGGVVYAIKNGNAQKVSSAEIESIVSRNINSRFGERFEDTLEEVSTEAVLLAKVPRGIPIVLEIQRNLRYVSPRAFTPEPPALNLDDREAASLVHDVYQKALEQAMLGLPSTDGNLTLPYFNRTVEPRFVDHYLRFTTQRAQAQADFLDKVHPPEIKKTTLLAFLGGGITIAEPGFLAARMPLMLLDIPKSFEGTAYALAGWLKSSFVTWYCAVHLASPDLFLHLQIPTEPLSIPRAKADSDFLRRLDSLVRNIVLDENKLLKEIYKQKARGAESDYVDKEIDHHNSRMNAVCLTIDQEIFRFLGVSEEDSQFIAKTLKDIRLSDFGLLSQAAKEDTKTPRE
jgi:hypothetical protein